MQAHPSSDGPFLASFPAPRPRDRAALDEIELLSELMILANRSEGDAALADVDTALGLDYDDDTRATESAARRHAS